MRIYSTYYDWHLQNIAHQSDPHIGTFSVVYFFLHLKKTFQIQ